ncbi:MAG: nuclear transport factor 2 family protein [Cyclobacteriaceae bacterium]|nr:nuclear transport factor 2 family protein [Cyclobacteriaceae bacterium]
MVSIRVQGNTASVETELYWPGIYYYDFLTLIKVNGTWKIVHKSWWEKKL